MITTVTMSLDEFRKMEKIIDCYDRLCEKLVVHNLGLDKDTQDIGIQVFLSHEVINKRDWYYEFKALVKRKVWPEDFERLNK